MYKWDHRRSCWRYKDKVPDLADKFPKDVNPYQFADVFKITYECFVVLVDWLVEKCNEDQSWDTPWSRWLHSRRSTSMSPETAVACVVLHLFTTGTCDRNAFMLGVPASTYLLIADILTLELAMRVSEVIQFPPEKDQVCMRSNELKQPMPGALFAMDGTLCRLPHRGKYNEFVSRKSQPQINVLVVCDWNKNLVYVEPGFTGRTQDNDMFNNSVLHEEMKLPDFPLREGGYILVDEGFACNGRIIRPYSKKRDELDIQFFNKVFKSTRLIVENAIGAWKEKCPLLNIGMHDQDPKDLTVTILASAVLYQFCKTTNEVLENVDNSAYEKKAKFIPPEFIGLKGDDLRSTIKLYLIEHYPEQYQKFVNETPEERDRY